MILKSYHFTNWGPHREQNIVFPDGAKTIALVAENDQGKSWVVRGIGFCLAIGRNEYGDQTAIHEGETESYHKLTVEHGGKIHTIEKTVRNKKSKDEGTTTIINGEPADRSVYESFYQTTLGLPHPSVWLPIMIAMQNETDAHLRRKKSEREAALRAACQLTRVDSWKDALQARTNEEDKTLIAEKASLKTKEEGINKEISEIKAELEELETRLLSLNQPFGPEGESLDHILTLVKSFEEAKNSKTRLELDLENKTKDQGLAENAHKRATATLAELPGGSIEDETAALEKSENLQTEIKAREKAALETRLVKSIQTNGKQRKEIAAIPETKKVDSNELDRIAATTENALETLVEKTSVCQTLQIENPTSQLVTETQEEVRDLEKAIERDKKILADLKNNGKAIQTAMATCATDLPEIGNETDPEAALKSIHDELEGHLEFGTGPLGTNEASDITLRVLQHWESHPHGSCPVCESNLKEIPTFTNPKLRAALIQGLLAEKQDPAAVSKKRKGLLLASARLEGACAHKQELVAKNAWPNWDAKTEEMAAAEAKNLTEITRLKKIAEAAQNLVDASSAFLRNCEAIQTLLPDKTSAEVSVDNVTQVLIEPARKTAAEARDAKNRKNLIETQIEATDREIADLEEQLKNFDGVPDPSTEWESEETGLLKTQLEEARQKLKTLRETRMARSNAEKELAAAKIRETNATEAAEKTRNELQAVVRTLALGAGMPKHPMQPDDNKTASAELWKDAEHERAGTTARIKPLQERGTSRRKEQEELKTTIAKIEARVARAQAARNLLAFLDYKNAPRKLLASICERLFETTNRIAEVLQADIRLKIGKDLDFLTVQHRNGRIIEQRTERLGFGKGAVLGICFRLACQKLLLPDTGFLILDEPTANVDTKRKNALKTFLQNLSEEKESKIKQIILIEHDMDVIELCQAKIRIGEKP